MAKKRLNLSAFCAVMVCAIIWGGQPAAVKISVTDLSPAFAVGIRLLIASLLVGVIFLVQGKKLKLDRKEIKPILFLAVLSVCQMGFFALGTSLTSSVRTAILINTFPVFTAITCHLFLPDFRIGLRNLLSIIVAVLGVAVVMMGSEGFSLDGSVTGDVLVLIAALIVGSRITIAKYILRTIDPHKLVFWIGVITCPIFFIISFIFETPSFDEFKIRTLIAILYQSLLGSILAVVLWINLLSAHNPNELAIFRLTTPIIGVAFGWLVLDENVSWLTIVGCALVVLAIYS